MDCSSAGFSVHGILQARIPEWVAMLMPSSRWSSYPGMKPMFLLSPALAGEFLGSTWEAHIFPLDFQYIYCPKDIWRGQKMIIFIFAQFAAIWSLKTFLFCHFSTNILFFVQKLCELHVLTTPLSYLWLNSLVCVHDTCITKMSVCSFYAKFSLVSLICMVPVREPRHIKKKRIILFSLQHVPLLKDGVLWHTWSSFDMMVKLSRTLLGL